MASTNQSPFYQRAEEDFLKATTLEEKMKCLDIMIKECPKHKGAEKMLAQLKTRQKKLKEQFNKQSKKGKSNQQGIRKAEIQCVLIGYPNTGKSTIFKKLTNLETKISPHPFTTYEPKLGTFSYQDTQIQIIDDAPIPNQNKSIINTTDTLLIVIDNLEQIKKIEGEIQKSNAERIYIFNKTDLLNDQEKRKLKETIKSKYNKINFLLFSKKEDNYQLEELKKEIFKSFPIIRIYTKEPSKEPSKIPLILKQGSKVSDVAEKILKGLSKKIKIAKITGPSAKFIEQTVGLDHVLKDRDVVELKIK